VPKDFYKLVISIGFCLFVGFAGSLTTTPSIETWYATLQKPFFNPPNWIFGPVWTLLYILMGIAAFLVWRKGTKNKIVKLAFKLFLLQLTLNFLWSLIFFGFHLPRAAFGEIMLLCIAIFLTIKVFSRISKYSGWLMIPYLLWVSFATILNLAIVILN